MSQNSSLQIFRLVQDKKDRIKEAILTEEIPQDFGVIISNLQADSDGNLFYLKKAAMNFSIECYNPATRAARSLPLPQGDIFPKDLAVATDSTGTVAYFSYVQPGTMPRLGKLAIGRLVRRNSPCIRMTFPADSFPPPRWARTSFFLSGDFWRATGFTLPVPAP